MDVLNRSGAQYVIAGGWVPVLLGAGHKTLTHEGTSDVDVLFDDHLDRVTSAARALLASGFVASAKHPFQLLWTASVGGTPMVFNVDLMHPHEREPGQFHDIFDLGVWQDYNAGEPRRVKSICFKSSQVVFDRKLYSTETVEGRDLYGENVSRAVPLLSPGALVLSKCESVSQRKRTRDAFDIYYILSGPKGEAAACELRGLAAEYEQVAAQLDTLKAFLQTNPGQFDSNVSLHAKVELEGAADRVLDWLFR